jgi:hypothetical protein
MKQAHKYNIKKQTETLGRLRFYDESHSLYVFMNFFTYFDWNLRVAWSNMNGSASETPA